MHSESPVIAEIRELLAISGECLLTDDDPVEAFCDESIEPFGEREDTDRTVQPSEAA